MADRSAGGCAFRSGWTRRHRRRSRAATGALLLAAWANPALAGDLPEACDAKDPPANKPFDVHLSTEIATDYIYRGVTLSAHQPAVGASIELDRGPFYFKFEPHSVKLPTNPSAELGFAGGWCREVVKNIKLDIGLAYLYYAGEVPVGPVVSTSYAEAHATVSYDHPNEFFTVTGTYAYSPNYSNTGAWEHYVEGGLDVSHGEDLSQTASEGHRLVNFRQRGPLLVRHSVGEPRRVSAARLHQLVAWHFLRLRTVQPVVHLFQYQLDQGKLFRLHRRPDCR